MKPSVRHVTLAMLLLTAPARPGLTGADWQPRVRDLKLPSGKSQQEEILKADHKKDLEDAATLIALAGQLKAELEKNDRYVLSVSSIRKTEDIEKLAKRIRGRLRRY